MTETAWKVTPFGDPVPATTPQTWVEAVDAILAEMRAVMIERQKKYGPDNIRRAGLMGVLIRAEHDKIGRIRRVYERDELRRQVVEAGMPQDVVDEYLPALTADFGDDAIEDAHLDAANYLGPISLMLRRGWWDLPFGE